MEQLMSGTACDLTNSRQSFPANDESLSGIAIGRHSSRSDKQPSLPHSMSTVRLLRPCNIKHIIALLFYINIVHTLCRPKYSLKMQHFYYVVLTIASILMMIGFFAIDVPCKPHTYKV